MDESSLKQGSIDDDKHGKTWKNNLSVQG